MNLNQYNYEIAKEFWELKYQYKEADGTPIDETEEDTWRRIAKALAKAEPKDQEYWEECFFETLEGYKFMPAGRIAAGAGTGRNVTLFNCFVMGTVPDDLGGIFDMLKEAAVTMQQGGGIGYDFSTIRPKGALVKGVAADASGPLTFMDVWDSACRTIMSAGTRRGAMMATLRCDHPDVEAFIEAKRDPIRLRMFNMSVLITDDFMEAVENGDEWELKFEGKVYKTIDAKSLWDKIMMSTYHYAEPGVIFIDRINQMNNLWYCEQIAATNPCGEQPLPPYGACLLGSINLVAMLKDGGIDYRLLARTIYMAVRMLDNVIEVSKFPLPLQKKDAFDKRRIGLGYTALADCLALLGIEYGSDEAVSFTEHLSAYICNEAYQASALLSADKGSFPLYNEEQYLSGEFVKGLWPTTKDMISVFGIRNSHLISIAPTGTISLYAGNVSSGVEPIFALEYERDVMQKDGSKVKQVVRDWAVAKWKQDNPEEPLPKSFVTAQTLAPAAHVNMQAAAQQWVDSSISKTINCPEDISFDDFKEVYMLAWRLGCKGCTTYRPNDVTGSVLTAKDPEEVGGACEIKFDENTGQLIRSCE